MFNLQCEISGIAGGRKRKNFALIENSVKTNRNVKCLTKTKKK